MNEQLPDEFDVIVLGTGLSESILSGALSRVGKKVLHLDHRKTYGGDWSSFNLRGFEEWIEEGKKEVSIFGTESIENMIDDTTESLIPIRTIRKTVDGGETICYLRDEKTKTEKGNGESSSEWDFDVENSNPKSDAKAPVTEQKHVEEIPETEVTATESCDLQTAQEVENAIEASTVSEIDNQRVADNEGKSEVVVENISQTCGFLKKRPAEIKKEFDERSREYFYSKWRHYNLDLAPKLMFSRGKLVKLLIASNVCRYLEFRNVTGTLTLMGLGDGPQKLASVPCSRTDIFNSKLVSMVEKRMLMKVLTICANYENHLEDYEDFANRPFIEFLAAKKLSKKLQHFIIHSIAMVREDADTLEGLKASEKFLKSLGRYGNSAFLWTTYGVGELPQAFCRLGAVFGGTFCLNRSVQGIVVSKESGRCVAIIDSTGQRLKCNHLILNECYVPESCRVPFSEAVARAIYITDSSFMHGGNGNVSLVTIPPTEELAPARLIEVGASCCVCPSKLHLVHGMMKIKEMESGQMPSPRSQFLKLEKVLFNGMGYGEETFTGSANDGNAEGQADTSKPVESTGPNVLWAGYFNMMSNGANCATLPDNLLVTKGPDIELGFDETVSEARSLFEAICPDEEFLPRAPNPEEIVYFNQNDEGYNTETNGAGSNRQTPDDVPGEYQDDEGDFGTGEPSEVEESRQSSQAAVERIPLNEESTE